MVAAASCEDRQGRQSLAARMKFNIDKCYTMQAGRTRHNILSTYILHDDPLPITESTKYLGITISSDLKLNKHISSITSKANRTLGILRRNLKLSSHTVKTHAYQALFRPHLEYAFAVWDPIHITTRKNWRWCSVLQPGVRSLA